MPQLVPDRQVVAVGLDDGVDLGLRCLRRRVDRPGERLGSLDLEQHEDDDERAENDEDRLEQSADDETDRGDSLPETPAASPLPAGARGESSSPELLLAIVQQLNP